MLVEFVSNSFSMTNGTVFYLGSFLGSPFFEMMNGLKYATYDRQNMLRVKWLQTYNRC